MKIKYRNTAFLVEVLVNILVFSICCAVLVSAFVKASVLVRQTKEDNQATAEVYALLETVKLRGAEGLEYAQMQEDGSLLLEYDKDWLPTRNGEGRYLVRLVLEEEARQSGTLYYIEAWGHDKSGRQMCHLETAVYYSVAIGGAA